MALTLKRWGTLALGPVSDIQSCSLFVMYVLVSVLAEYVCQSAYFCLALIHVHCTHLDLGTYDRRDSYAGVMFEDYAAVIKITIVISR